MRRRWRTTARHDLMLQAENSAESLPFHPVHKLAKILSIGGEKWEPMKQMRRFGNCLICLILRGICLVISDLQKT